ncbi:hypothetical protein [Catellatospora methionotrophica]|uniref:hypothetical protein n=1 Tax=Catellatospora methionotrophica TaxID=121620 RepID=UPI0033FE6A89
MASVPGHDGRVNEDFAAATATAAVLVDGAGIPGAEAACRHGVAWYAVRLGGSLLGLLTLDPASSLTAVLAMAIDEVTGEHRDTCDVADPISPSAAVAMLRVSGDRLDHLVLGDATLVLNRAEGEPLVVTDPREVVISRSYASALAGRTPASEEYRSVLRELRARRNRPGGFWVAKDDPGAAHQALTGTCAVAGLTGAALLSNGASRLVDRFASTSWPDAMALLATHGPGEIIDRVRRAEARHAVAADDATIVHCTWLDQA